MCTDSRQIKENCLFFALKGPAFNANDYVLDSLRNGAAYAVADEYRSGFEDNDRIIMVEDALATLQMLAREHRSSLKIPIIGLTGSNGKTTSKELLYSALSQTYDTYATKGNLNNHIGVPLSLLEIGPDHEIAIIEMGANHIHEIAFLCNIAQPDVGFITNIGIAHLEGFGSEEGVFQGKKELFDYLIGENGTLFINTDDPKVMRAAEGHTGIYYGSAEPAHFRGSFELIDGKLLVNWWRDIDTFQRKIQTQLSGSYNFLNVMAAVAVARYFGVPDDKLKKGIEKYKPSNNRSQIEHTQRKNTVIVDCYNANPSSMQAAITNLALQESDDKMVILGDMLELGDASESIHRDLVEQLVKHNFSAYLVGEHFGRIQQSHFNHFPATTDLAAHLKKEPLSGKLILLKGSRKMKLEQLLELL